MQRLKEIIRQAIDALRRFISTHRGILAAILGGILIGLFLWIGPKYHVSSYRKNFIDKHYWSLTPNERTQLDREMLKAENDARVTLAQILGGIALLSGLYFTWRNLRINEDGKITDRYSKAIELLGSDKLDIRLGGIYALERIAKDSEKDHWAVMEALTAFVREHSPVKPQKPAQGELFESEDKKPIATDIQAALTVIGRRKWIEREKERNQWIIDLRKADLEGANLEGANFEGAFLEGVNLSHARLFNANMSGAFLGRANLRRAGLGNVDLRGAFLREALLTNAYLANGKLNCVHLQEANLSEAYLMKVDLSEAYLLDTILHGAFLPGAVFNDANLDGADFSRADLRRCEIHGLSSVEEVSGADLKEVRNLRWDQIKDAIIDKTTKLPPDLQEKWNAENQNLSS